MLHIIYRETNLSVVGYAHGEKTNSCFGCSLSACIVLFPLADVLRDFSFFSRIDFALFLFRFHLGTRLRRRR